MMPRAILAASLLLLASILPTDAGLTFNFIPDPGTPANVVTGFTAAANLWSAVLADDITINIGIGYTTLDFSVIGSTFTDWYNFHAPTPMYTDFVAALTARRTSADDYSAVASLQSGLTYSRWINYTTNNPSGPASLTPYIDTMDWVGVSLANAKAFGWTPTTNPATDGHITFNSIYDFMFDFTHDTITPGQYDFVGAAAHEIGHLLGFVSGVDDIDVAAGTADGTNYSSNVIDFFRYSALSSSNGYNDYTAGTDPKYFSVDGGTNIIAYFSTGKVVGDGQQASHWTTNGIMKPTLAQGEQFNITEIDKRALDVMGYTLVPEPGSNALVLLGFGALLAFVPRRVRNQSR